MLRESRRWRTRFGRWVRHVGVPSLTDRLRSAGHPVTPKAIYNWVSGEHAPRPGCASALVQISRGRIALEDVYRHREVVVRRTPSEAGNQPQRGVV